MTEEKVTCPNCHKEIVWHDSEQNPRICSCGYAFDETKSAIRELIKPACLLLSFLPSTIVFVDKKLTDERWFLPFTALWCISAGIILFKSPRGDKATQIMFGVFAGISLGALNLLITFCAYCDLGSFSP